MGDPGLIPGLETVPGEGIGYPLQDSWASLVAQLEIIHLQYERPAFDSLGQEDPLEEGMATHSSESSWTEEPGGLQSHQGSQRVGHD